MSLTILRGNIVSAPAPGRLEAVEGGYLVAEDGVIAGVFPTLPERYAGAAVEDWGGALILQSLADLHLHAPQYPLMGTGMDLPLLEWLNAYAFPTEARCADPDYARQLYRLLARDLILITAVFMVRYVKNVNYDEVKDKLDTELVEKYGFRIYLPVVVLVALILVIQVLKLVDDTGMPPLFLIAALVACFTGRKMNPLVAARDACADVLPVMGNLMGIGSFVQIMTLNGVRGMITTYCLVLPLALRYVAMGTVIPAFSGISSLGAATVLGIPFVLAFLDSDVIIVSCALSLLCAVGDVMPPSALAGQFSSRLAKVDKYSKVLKSCLPFVLLCVIYGVVLVIFANPIGKLF